jgi:hypothetical protein
MEIPPAELPSNEAGGTRWRKYWILSAKYLFFTPVGFFNTQQILRNGIDDFTSPPKEVSYECLVSLKVSPPTAGFEPAKLGSNTKHATTRLPRTPVVNHTRYQSKTDILRAIARYTLDFPTLGTCRYCVLFVLVLSQFIHIQCFFVITTQIPT